jgi:DNA-binding PadR family transcriptional regulator
LAANELNSDISAKEQLIKRLVSSVLDIIIVMHFKQEPFSGYDVIQFVHKQLNVLLSPGTIYSTLYAMERDDLLVTFMVPNRRMFKATEKGLRLPKLLSSPDEIAAFLAKVKQM